MHVLIITLHFLSLRGIKRVFYLMIKKMCNDDENAVTVTCLLIKI